MKEEGYGRDYQYPHDVPDGFVETSNLPESLAHERFYEPTDHGAEEQIAKRLGTWRRRRNSEA